MLILYFFMNSNLLINGSIIWYYERHNWQMINFNNYTLLYVINPYYDDQLAVGIIKRATVMIS